MERFMERNGVFFDDEMIKKYRIAGISRDQLLADALDKLNDYEDAEEEGRLIILPCKPGDEVYCFFYLSDERIQKTEVKRIEIMNSVMGSKRYIVEPVGRRGCLFKYYDGDFGKTIFLTREAAEQRKAELEKGEAT